MINLCLTKMRQKRKEANSFHCIFIVFHLPPIMSIDISREVTLNCTPVLYFLPKYIDYKNI